MSAGVTAARARLTSGSGTWLQQVIERGDMAGVVPLSDGGWAGTRRHHERLAGGDDPGDVVRRSDRVRALDTRQERRRALP